ncbi:Glutathione S-transferase protein [Aphelenchoides fujianensis]|nr:Glutathione S-transferase protein [Aphelenchoides fujianensis]
MTDGYRLTYFRGRGLCEAARLCLHYKEQKFEDLRLTNEQFDQVRGSTLNGQLPQLEVDGHKIGQSGAILRFLAKRLKLDGKDEFEAARADEIWSFFYDAIKQQVPYSLVILGMSNEDKDKLHEEVFLPVAKRSLEFYKPLINNSKKGYLLESGISYADFVVAEHLNTIFQLDSGLKTKYPDLHIYMESIHSLPQIQSYVKSRPESKV